MASGMSLAALGRATHYSKGYLSKLETGAKPPTPEAAAVCDAALDAGGALVNLAPSRSPEPTDLARHPVEDQEVWVMNMTPDGRTGFTGLDRRSALSLGAVSMLGAGADPPPSVRQHVTPAGLEGFRHQLGGLRALGQSVSPSVVFPMAAAQTSALRQLARSTSSTHRDAVLRLGARFAEYTGWMAQESGNDRGALWWTDTAVSMAAAGGDHDMGRYALVRRALITLYAHDGAQTIALAERAQRDPSTSARVRGLAAKREAQGHALTGDLTACEQALEQARTLLVPASENHTGPEVLGSSRVPDQVGVVRGWCLVDLGRPGEAARVLDRELALLPESAVRARVRFGVRRALAHALSGELEHACQLTDMLLSEGTLADSATVTVDLRRLSQTLARHHGNRSVRELAPRLVSALNRS
jgi:hypothetical protein